MYVVNWTEFDGGRHYTRRHADKLAAIHEADYRWHQGCDDVCVWAGDGTEADPSVCIYSYAPGWRLPPVVAREVYGITD
jgi:hypothetical protein